MESKFQETSIKFPIYVKPPQSGKTQDAIIKPMKKSIKSGRVPVIIIPSRIQLQKQLSKRIIDEFDTLEYCNIGRFDTGNIRNRLRTIKCSLKLLDKENIKVFIILNNQQGFMKLISLMSQSTKKFDIIIDEIHGFFNNYNSDLKDCDRQSIQELIDSKFWNVLKVFQEHKQIMEYNNIILNPIERISIFFDIIRKQGHTFSGTTATVSFVAQSKLLNLLDLEPLVIQLETPKCYYGYKKLNKSYYDGNYRNAIETIIQNNPKGTTTMCHVGRDRNTHIEAAFNWIRFCRLYNVPKKQILSIIDNSDGYTLYNWDHRLKQFEKSKTSEPWRLVDAFRNKFGYTHIGIFGDRCMSESNTYQKCNNGINCPINDLIVVPFNHNLDNITIMIQKIGRIFGNDTIGGNRRTIHFPDIKYREKIEQGIKFDELIQDECNLRTLDYQDIKKNIKSKNNNETTNGDRHEDEPHQIIREAKRNFPRWSKHTNKTLISLIMKKIDIDKKYDKQELINFIISLGGDNPATKISDMQRFNDGPSNGYGKIIEEIDNGKYKFREELKSLHIKYFVKL